MSARLNLGVALRPHLGGFAFGAAAVFLPRKRLPAAAALVGALALSARPALALDPARRLTQYVHETWRVQDGLPQGSIQALVQTRDGFLWMGTLEGLARFDGVRFAVFDRNNTKEIPHDDVQALCEDDGRLWIGTWGGLAVHEAGRFQAVPLPEGAEGSPVNALVCGGEGELWIATTRGLLHRAKDGAFRLYGTAEGLPSEDVGVLLRDGAGTLWIGTAAGLVRLRGESPETVAGPLGRDGILTLYEDREGTLWAGTARSGLYRAPRRDLARLARQEGLPDERIGAVLQDRDGSHWFGTASHGVVRLQDGRWESFSTRDGLSFDVVSAFLEDREGALWIGTDGGGLDRLREGKLWTYTAVEGLPHELLWTVYEDRRGALWIGSGGGGLIRFEGGRFRQYAAPEGLPSRRFMALAEDARGTLWVGGWGDGLFRLQGDRLVRARRDPAFITALLFDRDGDLWIGTEKEGLAVLRQGALVRYTTRDGLPSDNVRALLFDRRGDLWIGSDGGLTRLTRGRFMKLTTYTTRQGLPHNTVSEIHEDGDALWLGTYGGGLARMQGERLVTVNRAAGLFDDVVYRILEDGQGRFWMSSNKGIFAVSRRELNEFAAGRRSAVRSVPFGVSDGMRNIECQGFYQPAGWKGRDGRLWFPTIKGLVVVDPEHMRLNSLPPPVAVEAVRANERPAPLQEGLVLPPGRTDLEFHYTALSLLQPARVAFRYRLEGFDGDWVEAGSRRVAYYTNVPPGSYRFRVQAANNDGVWNEAGASLGLRLRPRFRQTAWFYLLCAGMLGLFAFGLHRVRVAHLHERRHELEDLVAERTRDLEQTNRKLGEANEQLALLATEDGLTGAFNRRYFELLLESEWKRATRERSPLALLMMDIDHFKKLNDAYGHLTGDQCLRRVAAALMEAVKRPADMVARYGGEEFVALLPATGADGAQVMAERMRAAVERLGIEHRASEYGHVTISCGLAAMVPEVDRPASGLVERADHALYRAKEGGRNRVVAETG